MSFFMTNLTIKFCKISLLKLSYKNKYVKFDAFQGEMVNYFPQKRGEEKRKC